MDKRDKEQHRCSEYSDVFANNNALLRELDTTENLQCGLCGEKFQEVVEGIVTKEVYPDQCNQCEVRDRFRTTTSLGTRNCCSLLN